jgi:integrase
VKLGKTKTDQEGQGMTKFLSASELRAIDPVENLRVWLLGAGIKDGPLFRRVDRHGNVGKHALTGESIAQVWKAAAKRAGLDPVEIAGHSARRGFITAAYNAELAEADIMQHTGHQSPTVMRGYREDSGVASRKVSRVVLNG